MKDEQDKVVMVTSTIPHEGKSSFSVNLALTWATLGKKVLLIDLDLRASNLKHILDIEAVYGMSYYLSTPHATPQEVIKTSSQNANVEVALAGNYPPNPVALLMSNRLEEFITYTRATYDYIIIDTPPTIIVTDPVIINRVADSCIFITRSGVTHKRSLRLAEELYRDNKLKNMSYVLKGIEAQKSKAYSYYAHNYGYGYGYYGHDGYGSTYGGTDSDKKEKRKKSHK
jgi:capsular exopolysaccharide synthesis family protein